MEILLLNVADDGHIRGFHHGEAVGLRAVEEDEVVGGREHHVAAVEVERHGRDGGHLALDGAPEAELQARDVVGFARVRLRRGVHGGQDGVVGGLRELGHRGARVEDGAGAAHSVDVEDGGGDV